ncbi:MAG: cytochrome c-type biogenesis protein CcmH [Chloroflexi bacterium]|nr:cytochrome c-type biogenesis protein CcmH [Chloroflexota bacterium]
MKHWRTLRLILFLLLSATAVGAQEEVSDDEINRVADRLYCPTCANQAVSACATKTCQLWREEVRRQLAAGKGDEEILANFVSLYGAEVLGEPDDATGFTLTYLPVFFALLVAILVLLRVRKAVPHE